MCFPERKKIGFHQIFCHGRIAAAADRSIDRRYLCRKHKHTSFRNNTEPHRSGFSQQGNADNPLFHPAAQIIHRSGGRGGIGCFRCHSAKHNAQPSRLSRNHRHLCRRRLEHHLAAGLFPRPLPVVGSGGLCRGIRGGGAGLYPCPA